MDVQKLALKAAISAIILSSLLSGPVLAKERPVLIWDSGFESFCAGPCVSAYKSEKGVILFFTDPVDNSTTFVRELALPKGVTIGRPKLVSIVNAHGLSDDTQQWFDSKTSGTIPPPPAGGSGVVTAEGSIYNSRGGLAGIAIIRYYFIDGRLVNVTVDYISLDQGHVE